MKKSIILTVLITFSSLFAEDVSYVEYVHVTHSEPIYENVITREPYQECYDEQVPVTYSYTREVDSGLNAGALVGGVSGGFIGKQISRGDPAATIGGAILGTIVGQNAAKTQPQTEYQTRYETRRKCTTHYTERSERRFMGYRNTAYYKGREITKMSGEKLSTIPVTVTVRY